MYRELAKILPKEILFFNEPLKKHSTFRIGGPADLLVSPRNIQELIQIFSCLQLYNLRYTVIGNGSNILFSDEGFHGVVIKLGSQYSSITSEDRGDKVILRANAGALLSRLASFACNMGLTGLEFAAGIPGSVGGAIVMNAGAYGGEISHVLTSSTCINTSSLCLEKKNKEAHEFSYRHSTYQYDGKIITDGEFCLERGNKSEIEEQIKILNARRIEKQPLEFPSAGSTFKRPEGYFAGKLIEDCGLRGFRIGGAMVSEKHCGFVINTGNATCHDVRSVIEYVRETVFKYNGIMLETEVKIIEG